MASRASHAWCARGGSAKAVLLGVVTGVAVTLVFEKVFYVRLP
jgi:hypothetical protein